MKSAIKTELRSSGRGSLEKKPAGYTNSLFPLAKSREVRPCDTANAGTSIGPVLVVVSKENMGAAILDCLELGMII